MYIIVKNIIEHTGLVGSVLAFLAICKKVLFTTTPKSFTAVLMCQEISSLYICTVVVCVCQCYLFS